MSQADEKLYLRAAHLNYDDARRYVESRGWARIATRRSEVGVFRLGNHEAHLPMDSSLRDYASAMVLFARTVAEAEHRTTDNVVRDLAAARVDRHRPARVGAEPEGASLDAASAMLDGIRRALLASACSVLAPRPFHPRMSLGDAEAFVAQTHFSHTEVGSLVMVVDTPTECDGAREGFGRDASVLLVRSLAHLTNSLRAATPDRVVNPLEGEPQVSTNLCEALLRMAPPTEAADLRFEVNWSPLLPLPTGIPKQVIVDRIMFEAIEKLASEMRPSLTEEHNWHVGFVKELKGSRGPNGNEGAVVFSLVEDEATTLRARAHLDAALYRKALMAHAGGRVVTVEGELHRSRRGYELRNVTDIEEM